VADIVGGSMRSDEEVRKEITHIEMRQSYVNDKQAGAVAALRWVLGWPHGEEHIPYLDAGKEDQ
jgi:hypothetical protein